MESKTQDEQGREEGIRKTLNPCRGCHNFRGGLGCELYPNPEWIWETYYCPEKERRENFVPEWFRHENNCD
jgi:hypothetical protein